MSTLQNRRESARDIGDIGERFLLKYLNNNKILHHYQKFEANAFKPEFYEYDFFIDMFGGVTVEVKYDNYSCNSNNFAIETRTRMATQSISQYKASGIMSSCADFWLFLQPTSYDSKDIANFWVIELNLLKHCTFFNKEFVEETFNHLSWDCRNVLHKTVRYEKEVYADTGTVQELYYVPVPLIQSMSHCFGKIDIFNINVFKK